MKEEKLNASNQGIVSWLFQTKALEVSPQDKPFWYTSGTIGPYYINTHYLYGSEEKANALLQLIDREKENIFTCSKDVFEETQKNYQNDSIYRQVIDSMCALIKNRIDLQEVDYISGGERRDWFFSFIVADILQKPHITIFKDLSTVIYFDGKSEATGNLQGKNVLHIADLITEASSYERAWIPAISNLGAIMKWSVVVVDRKQGGEEFLNSKNIDSYSMIKVDQQLFSSALALGFINQEQFELISAYTKDPKASMRNFLLEHKDFFKNALEGNSKTKGRAELCVSKDIYELNK